ncbi:MAG TPA: LPS assembly protein LptD [Steroidobacteraceae bacterium]|nr:LPS assembly protein LptD [Steroidobacteraceae bacterium]
MPALFLRTRAFGATLGTVLLGLAGTAAAEDCGPTVDLSSPSNPAKPTTDLKAANDEEIVVESNKAQVTRAGDAELEGRVILRQGGRELSADHLEYHKDSDDFAVHGNVDYRDGTMHVHGSTGDYDPLKGATIGEASFELPSRPARGVADRILVKPDAHTELDNVKFTTCPLGNSDWILNASSIDLDTNSHTGSGKNVRLDFKGVPILYTPVISFPIGNERKSGFLFPGAGHSTRSGFELSVPYYFNLAPNYDLTETPKLLTDRGVQLGTEFRYLTGRQHGQLEVDYLPNDRVAETDRLYLEWKHTADFTDAWRARVDVANASDSKYFEDFALDPAGTSITYLERKVSFEYLDRTWSLFAELQNFQTIDQSIEEDARPYSSVPRLTAHGAWPRGWLGLAYSIDAEAVNFMRDVGVHGTRFDVAPEVSLPLSRPGMFFKPAVSWRYTAYLLEDRNPGEPDNPDRTAPTASLDTGLIFERSSGSRGQRIQTLEPRILYVYVPFRDQTDLPVFDTALPDLNLVELFRTNRYVGADRLSDANQVSLGVTSRLLEAQTGKQFLSATLGQTYYFDTPKVTLPDETPPGGSSSDLIAQLAVTAYKDWNINLGYQWNPEAPHSDKSEVAVQYRPAPDSVVNVGYRYRKGQLEQGDLSAIWPVGKGWHVFGRFVYSMKDDSAIDRFAGFEYRACCWKFRLLARDYVSSRTGERDRSIGFELELNGLSNVGTSAGAFLERSIRGYSAVP